MCADMDVLTRRQHMVHTQHKGGADRMLARACRCDPGHSTGPQMCADLDVFTRRQHRAHAQHRGRVDRMWAGVRGCDSGLKTGPTLTLSNGTRVTLCVDLNSGRGARG